MNLANQLWEQAQQSIGGYREAGPAEVMAVDEATIIDVREPHEWTGDYPRLPHAKLVPLGELPGIVETLDRDALYVIVCHSGARSARAAAFLSGQGFTRVVNMTGGMVAYHTEENK